MKDVQRAATVWTQDEIALRFDSQGLDAHKAMSVSEQACGKTIIVGEHAVVYGASAVAMPLLKHCMKIVLSPMRHNPARSPQFKMLMDGREMSPMVSSVIVDAFKTLEIPPFSVLIEGSHCLPIGAGLGSSATLCIVILRAICKSLGKSLKPETLASLGNVLEERFHGKPSGLDTAVVAFEKTILFKKNTPAKMLTAKKLKLSPSSRSGEPWRFVLIDSGVRSSTLTMIKKAAPYFQSPTHGEKRLERFNGLSLQVSHGLEHGNHAQVANAMQEVGTYLAEAGVVNEQLATIMEVCRAAQIPASKPTGAGGGGAILCLLDPDKHQYQVEILRTNLSPLQLFTVDLP